MMTTARTDNAPIMSRAITLLTYCTLVAVSTKLCDASHAYPWTLNITIVDINSSSDLRHSNGAQEIRNRASIT